MHRDVIGLIAFDLVLRIILARMNCVAFERDPGSNDSGDPAADSAGFRIPAHVISPLEALLSHSIPRYAGMVKS
jgi:hypothetical protein